MNILAKFPVKAVASAAIALAVSSAATANIKYWDNPAYRAFDVGDYVQDGLVLNYDGIRNAGADAEHDSTATTWANLGSGGSAYDMKQYSLVGSNWQKGAATGSWTDHGFVFGKTSVFAQSEPIVIPMKRTMQVLVDAKSSEQGGIGDVVGCYNGSKWDQFSICMRSDGTVANTFYIPVFSHTATTTSQRPYIKTSDARYDYGTAIINENDAVWFAGTTAPWAAAATGGATGHYKNGNFAAYEYEDQGLSLGGRYPNTIQTFKGTVKFFRFYHRCLSDEEVGWNRVVDEARYFGRKAALPVTNVVVASNIPVACGAEPAGCYALDGTYTFSAPASQIVKGRTYTLNGYTIEVWDESASAWGEAEEYSGNSYEASASKLVRLTWRWTPGDGLVNYDVDDYVQDGLILNYDGIRNAGADAEHDNAATTWKNLGSLGSTYDMVRHSYVDSSLVANSAATGAWTENGFAFDRSSLFHLKAGQAFTVGTEYTLQALVDTYADRHSANSSQIGYLMCPSVEDNSNEYQRFTIGVRNSSATYGGVELASSIYHCAADNAGLERAAIPGNHFDYVTVMLNWNEAIVFSGTEAIWSGINATGYMTSSSAKPYARTYTKGFSLGGQLPYNKQLLNGHFNCYRHYDRVLNNDELAWNRLVDNARFFPVTNVVVATTRAGVFGNEKDGAYQVSGSYTFTAPESVTVGKTTYAPAGYAIQAWDGENGVWGAATEHEGSSYAYTAEAGKVRLLWRWKGVRGLRTAADYDVQDYVAGGLLLNYDGIRNAGTGHDPAATTWVNLGTAGAAHDAVLSNEVDAAGSWMDSGYDFDGKCRFIAKMAYNPTYTIQFLSDAVQNEQSDDKETTIYFICGDANTRFAYATYNQYLYPRVQTNGNDSTLRMLIDKAKPVGYVTGIQDQAGKRASVFSGTEAPVSGDNTRTYESMRTDTKFDDFCIGGWKWGLNQNLRGGINYMRYYDRVLSDSELEMNRAVDEARYFGRLSVTNVVVTAPKYGGGQAEPAGAYAVEGEWTFRAEPVLDERKNREREVIGYVVETWDGSAWVGAHTYSGDSYTHRTSEASAPVRLTWKWRPDGTMVILR